MRSLSECEKKSVSTKMALFKAWITEISANPSLVTRVLWRKDCIRSLIGMAGTPRRSFHRPFRSLRAAREHRRSRNSV